MFLYLAIFLVSAFVIIVLVMILLELRRLKNNYPDKVKRYANPDTYLAVKEDKEKYLLNPNGIIRIEGNQGKEKIIHCKGGRTYRIKNYNMHELKKKLGSDFILIHQSHLVNKRYIKAIKDNKAMIRGKAIPISSRNIHIARKAIK